MERASVSREERRRELLGSRMLEVLDRHGETLRKLKCLVRYVTRGDVRWGMWRNCEADANPRLFMGLRDESLWVEIKDLLSGTFIEQPVGGLGAVIGAVRSVGAVVVAQYVLGDLCEDWLGEKVHHRSDVITEMMEVSAERYAAITGQIEEIASLSKGIPQIDDSEVFGLMEFGGLVQSHDVMSVDDLRDSVQRIMTEYWMMRGGIFRVDLQNDGDIYAWKLAHYVRGFQLHGIAEKDIRQLIRTISEEAGRKVASMPREVDGLFGGYIYR